VGVRWSTVEISEARRVQCQEHGNCKHGKECGGAVPHWVGSECGHCPVNSQTQCVTVPEDSGE
jgi:hypothetical protein